MAQNFDHISMEDAQRLAKSEPGRKLIALLQNQDSRQLQKAMQQASFGDYEQMKKTLSAFMASPEAQSLLKQLEKQEHE